MRIDQMHYNFLLGLDRVASNDRPDMMPWEIDEYLNNAILQFVKSRYTFLPQVKRGFETDKGRIDALASLHIKSPEVQPAVIPNEVSPGVYELRLNSLGDNVSGQYFRYLFLTKLLILIRKDDCEKTIDATTWQIDDGKTHFNMPSWKWGRAHANFGKSTFVAIPPVNPNVGDSMDYTAILETGNPARLNNDELKSIYIDTNNKYGVKEFDIVEAYPSYIKRPNRVFAGGYNHIDIHSSNTDNPVHCDIDSAFHDEIISIAIELASADIQDPTTTQVRNQRNKEDLLM